MPNEKHTRLTAALDPERRAIERGMRDDAPIDDPELTPEEQALLDYGNTYWHASLAERLAGEQAERN